VSLVRLVCLFLQKRHAFFRIHTGRKYPDPKPMKNDETIKHHGYVIANDETIKHHGYVIAIALRAQFFIIL
jgi:hypothetical protein